MRRLPALILSLMATLTLLTACGDAEQRGRALAQEMIEVWGDTAAMHANAARFIAMRDSLTLPWQRKAANRGYATLLIGTGRDSLLQAAHAIVLSPTEFAQLKCQPMVDLLMRKQFDTDSVTDYLALMHWLCYTVGHDRHVQVLDSTLDAQVNELSIGEQMNVYSQATWPADLGAALAQDAQQPDADMAEIQARINILRGIYNEEEFATFEQAYNAALSPKNETETTTK